MFIDFPSTAKEAIDQFLRRNPDAAIDMNRDLVYVLHLLEGKFYVGRSSHFLKRLNTHFVRGSVWTREYPPIEVLALHQPVEDFDEDKITLRYMKQYGIDNVRGGTFSAVELKTSDKEVIQRMLTHAGGRCFTCHRKGHYASNCPEKRIEQYSRSLDNELKAAIEEALRLRRRMYTKLARSRGSRGQRHTNINFEDSDADYDSDDLYELLCYDSDEDDDEDDDDRPSKRRRTAKCYRCGRDGHMKSECYARTDLHGREIGPQSSTPPAACPAQARAISSPNSRAVVCARCQRTNHTVRNCYASTSADGHPLSEHFFAPASSTTRCRRCGRDGHTYNQCYASTHVSGRYL